MSVGVRSTEAFEELRGGPPESRTMNVSRQKKIKAGKSWDLHLSRTSIS